MDSNLDANSEKQGTDDDSARTAKAYLPAFLANDTASPYCGNLDVRGKDRGRDNSVPLRCSPLSDALSSFVELFYTFNENIGAVGGNDETRSSSLSRNADRRNPSSNSRVSPDRAGGESPPAYASSPPPRKSSKETGDAATAFVAAFAALDDNGSSSSSSSLNQSSTASSISQREGSADRLMATTAPSMAAINAFRQCSLENSPAMNAAATLTSPPPLQSAYRSLPSDPIMSKARWRSYLYEVRCAVSRPDATLSEREAAVTSLTENADRLYQLASVMCSTVEAAVVQQPATGTDGKTGASRDADSPPVSLPCTVKAGHESTSSGCLSMVTVMQLDTSLSCAERDGTLSTTTADEVPMVNSEASSKVLSQSSSTGWAQCKTRVPGVFSRGRRSSHIMTRDSVELINDYCVRQLIGRGTTGCVFLCEDRGTKALYAIKSVSKPKRRPNVGYHLLERNSSESAGTLLTSAAATSANHSSHNSNSNNNNGNSNGNSSSPAMEANCFSPVSSTVSKGGGAGSQQTSRTNSGTDRGSVVSRLRHITSPSPQKPKNAMSPTVSSDFHQSSFSPTSIVLGPTHFIVAGSAPMRRTATGGPPSILVNGLEVDSGSMLFSERLAMEDGGSTSGDERRMMGLATTQAAEIPFVSIAGGAPRQSSFRSSHIHRTAHQSGNTCESQDLPVDRSSTSSFSGRWLSASNPTSGSFVGRLVRGVTNTYSRANVVVASAAPPVLDVMLPAFGHGGRSGSGSGSGISCKEAQGDGSAETELPSSAAAGHSGRGHYRGHSANTHRSTMDELLSPVEREIRVLRRLKHPNIVKLHEVIDDEEEQIVHLVLDYVPNGPITTVHMFDPVAGYASCEVVRPLAKLTRICQQLTDAIQHLQRRYVVHNDLKPDNVLLDENGNVMLTDFGESALLPKKLVKQDLNASVAAGNFSRWNTVVQQPYGQGPPDSNTCTPRELMLTDHLPSCRSLGAASGPQDYYQPDSSMFLQSGVDLDGKLRGRLCAGTPAFNPPELIDRNECSFKTDMWSFGVILYSMLFGRLPFAGPTLRETFDAVVSADLVFPPLEDVPEHDEFTSETLSAWQALCRQLLVRSPAERMSVRALASHLPLMMVPDTCLPSPLPVPFSPSRAAYGPGFSRVFASHAALSAGDPGGEGFLFPWRQHEQQQQQRERLVFPGGFHVQPSLVGAHDKRESSIITLETISSAQSSALTPSLVPPGSWGRQGNAGCNLTQRPGTLAQFGSFTWGPHHGAKPSQLAGRDPEKVARTVVPLLGPRRGSASTSEGIGTTPCVTGANWPGRLPKTNSGLLKTGMASAFRNGKRTLLGGADGGGAAAGGGGAVGGMTDCRSSPTVCVLGEASQENRPHWSSQRYCDRSNTFDDGTSVSGTIAFISHDNASGIDSIMVSSSSLSSSDSSVVTTNTNIRTCGSMSSSRSAQERSKRRRRRSKAKIIPVHVSYEDVAGSSLVQQQQSQLSQSRRGTDVRRDSSARSSSASHPE